MQRHLRVCWKNVGNKVNCGRCEKCVRTMLALEACGKLGCFSGFDHGRGLIAAIDGLQCLEPIVILFFREMLASGLSAGLAAAVQRLLARSEATADRREQSPATVGKTRPRRAMSCRLLQPDAFAHVCEPLVGKYVGYVRPLGNVGDELIELAMAQLFAAYAIRWSLCDLAADLKFDVLVFGGGGNMGTRDMNNHELRGRAIALGVPLTILPQTFATKENRSFHRVYVRERDSLQFCSGGILAPDLALGLAWPAVPRPTRDLGIFLRKDRERRGARPLIARDPVRLCATPAEYLALAADHSRIITDRLHFAIAGLHAGRDVTLVANDYHKNRSMHDAWLANLGCGFADNVAEALNRVRRAA